MAAGRVRVAASVLNRIAEREFLLPVKRCDCLFAYGSSRISFPSLADDVEHDLVVTNSPQAG